MSNAGAVKYSLTLSTNNKACYAQHPNTFNSFID